jgi:hypothetical protein
VLCPACEHISQYSAHLARPVRQTLLIPCIALIQAVVSGMSKSHYNEACTGKGQGGIKVTAVRAPRAMRNQDQR